MLILTWRKVKVVVLRLPVTGNELELVSPVVLDPYPHVSANSEYFLRVNTITREGAKADVT